MASYEDNLPEWQRWLNQFCENWIFAFLSAPVSSSFITCPKPNLGCSTFMPSRSLEVSLGAKSDGTLYVVGRWTGCEVMVFFIPETKLLAKLLAGTESMPAYRVLTLMKFCAKPRK